MKEKKKKVKNMALRNRILLYVNAFLGLLIVVCGFACLALCNIEGGAFLLGFLLLIVPMFLSMVAEIDTFFFRFDKKTAIESLIPAGIYFICILIILFFPSVSGLIVAQIVCMSIYLSVRVGRLTLAEWRSDKKKRTKIIISVLFGIFLTACYLIPIFLNSLVSVIQFYSFVFILEGFAMIISSITNGKSLKTLPIILYKTHTLEILVGLVIVMITAATVFPFVEPKITNFSDGLWYSFAIVTTIGFGDFYAVTFIGRILSVLLGIYGIVVVALITSVIVNLYNESRKRRSDEEDEAIFAIITRRRKREGKSDEEIAEEIENLKKELNKNADE